MTEIYGKSFGNLLSAYWSSRAYSIFKQIDFNFKNYMKIDNKYHCAISSISKNLFQFFPLNIKYNQENSKYLSNFDGIISTTDNYTIDSLKSENINIDNFFNNETQRMFLYFSHMYLGSWDNIIEKIQIESDNNIKRYLNHINIDQPKYDENETVIHFRCGNVLSGDTHPDYHLLKFKYFKDNIDENCKKITIIWKIDYNDQNTKKETGFYERDLLVITKLKEYLESELNIFVEIHNDYFSDIIYMVYAPKLIITPSTFSFWCAIMSKNESVLPICNLLCGNRTPKLRENINWNNIDDYKISAHVSYQTKNNNLKILEELMK